MGLRLDGINEIQATLDDLNREIMEPKDMNRRRAVSFQKFAKGGLGGGRLGLKKPTAATRKIQGRKHEPLFDKGELVDQIKVKENETGFFDKDKTMPSPRRTSIGYLSTSRLTWTQIARIHAAGYSIPVSWNTPKGVRVRRWLMAHGIFLRRGTQWIHVPPRDVLTRALNRYKKTGRDSAVSVKYFDRLWQRLK